MNNLKLKRDELIYKVEAFKNTMHLLFITLFFIIAAGVLLKISPAGEKEQQILAAYKSVFVLLTILYCPVIVFSAIDEYIRNKKLPKAKRHYKTTMFQIFIVLTISLAQYILIFRYIK